MLAVVMGIITTATAYAENNSDSVVYYKVVLDENNVLNIRQEPSADADVVGKVPGNTKLDVISQTDDGEWYEVKYQECHGYAKSEYVKRYERKAGFGDNVSKMLAMSNILAPKWSNPHNSWVTIGLLILGIIIVFVQKYLSEDSEVHIVLTSILGTAIILYMLYMGSNALWFLNSSKVEGLGWIILNIFAFLYFVVIYVSSFYYTKKAMPVTPTFGIAIIGLFFVGLVVCAFVGSKYAPWLFGILVFSQIIQSVIIGRKGYIWYAIAYFVMAAALVMLLIPAFIIGVVVGIVLFCLMFLGSISKEDSTSSSSRDTYSSPEEPKYDIEIKGGGKYGEDVKAKTGFFGTAYDENGRRWKKNSDGTYSKDD